MEVKGFILETQNNGRMSSTVSTIFEIIRDHNLLRPDNRYDIKECHYNDLDTKLLNGMIPVGSIAFVNKALRLLGKNEMKPINIPEELNSYDILRRKTATVKSQAEIARKFKEWNTDKLFVKSNTSIKRFVSDLYPLWWKDFPEDEYFVSERLDIVSEWRCFVHCGKLRSIKNYSGDEWTMPYNFFVEDCINRIGENIKSYTLDVAVLKDGNNAVIEVHNFISCGLYGFDDDIILPMLINGYKRELQINE